MVKRFLVVTVVMLLFTSPVLGIINFALPTLKEKNQLELPTTKDSWQKLVAFDWDNLSQRDALNIAMPSAVLGLSAYGIVKYFPTTLNVIIPAAVFGLCAYSIFKCISYAKKKQEYASFYTWKNACGALPRFKSRVENSYQTPLHAQIFSQEIDKFFITMKHQLDNNVWIDGVKPAYLSDDFQAYAEKLIVPHDAVVAIHGDLHGDVHSVNRFIETCAQRGFLDEENPFKIKKKNFYMIFLGDYVDRGWYGAEVLYSIMRLKNENPDNVFMVRGNHEDVGLNSSYGFAREIHRKFSDNVLLDKINQLYNTLPVVMYLGAGMDGKYNIIQCCHGGIEIGFDPKNLLENKHLHAGVKISYLTQKSGFNHICCDQTNALRAYFNDKSISLSNGFMWSDFFVDPTRVLDLSARDGFMGTMFQYGQLPTKQLLKAWSGRSYQLRSIFRAHQHGDDDMKNRILNNDNISHPLDAGIGKLWINTWVHQHTPGLLDDVAVITFSVAPDAGYGWPIHSFGLLHVAPHYAQWRLENIVQQP